MMWKAVLVSAAMWLAVFIGAVALFGCAGELLPVPPIPPNPPIVAPLATVHPGALHTEYDAADARLREYKALPACAASGPILCFDAGKEQGAVLAGQEADTALRGSLHGKAGLRAKRRTAAFRRAAHRLPMP
jgi:hypothetical protein